MNPPEFQPVVAWLPTAGGAPVASSPMIAEPPPSTAAVALAPWEVSTLPIAPLQAIDLLVACSGTEVLRPGVLVGRDLSYWATVLRFAAALVARQQYLPGIARVGATYFARWQPVLTGADANRAAALARAMPHACRAASGDDGARPDPAARTVLDGVLAWLVDRLARDRAAWRSVPRTFDSVHDAWLAALRSEDGRIVSESSELPDLAEKIAEWRRPIDATASPPLRLCFRLEEPVGPDSAPWYVQYLLQDVADPSLLVPAEKVWNPKGATKAALARRDFDARGYLLAALGASAAMSREIEASLRSPAPAGFGTDATGAHEFLRRTAWMLEQAGYGVLLPAWWTRRGTKLRLTASASVKSPKLRAKGMLSLDSIVDVDWAVALGDTRLTLAELKALARLKAPLVRVRGQWVELSPEEIQTALDFWKKRGESMTARDVVRLALGGEREKDGLDFEGVEATGWMGELLAQLGDDGGFDELPPPAGLTGTLRPYQARGFSWLAFLKRWGFGACLADDMGLGKSIQTLALVERDWEENDERRPTLVVCPTSVVTNWRKEAERFTPGLPVMVHHGASRAKGATFRRQAEKHALVVSSYALLHRDFETFEGVSWRGVVLDEAQNVKNPETKQARAARRLAAEYRIALTGTPVENTVGDLWSIMEFLNPGWLGPQADFRRRFLLPIQTLGDPEASARLKKLTGPFVLRRLKTDRAIIRDLPEKNEMHVFCPLTKEQASLYQAVVDQAMEPLEDARGIERRGLILATLSKLKQVCNHPAQFLGDNSAIPNRSGKLARLVEMLEEAIAEGDRALVFTQFAQMGAIIKRHLEETFGRETLFLHGGVPKARRDEMIDRFQTKDGPPVFVLSLKAGGTGLNLTSANRVFHFDRWWNPAVENQATDRAFRIGQTRNVQVHKFVCAGTLEERIDEMIERKKAMAERVVGTGEAWLTELSTEELKEMFALRREAIEA